MLKTFTVRLRGDLYETARAVARRRQLSLNALVQEGLEAIAREEEEEKLYEAFGLLGEDAAEADVEFALDAQREVVSRGQESSGSRRKSRAR